MPTSPNNFAKSAAALLACSLMACQSEAPKPPAPQPAITATVPHIRLPVADRADVTYLARALMPGRYQTAAAVYSEAQDDAPNRISTTSANTAGVAAAGALGQSPLSNGGAATAAYGAEAVSVLQGLAAGKSASIQSGRAYLPDSANGVVFRSPEQVREFAREEAGKRVEEFARAAGRTVSCFDQCDSFFPTYMLSKAAGPAWPSYDPPALYLTIYLRKPADRRNSSNAVLDRILTYPLAWEEVFFISLSSTPPQGGHKTIDGENVPEFPDMSSFSTPLERTLLRVLTQKGVFAFGAQNWGQFAWDGRIFALGAADPANLIQYEISPATDQIAQPDK